jgi:hypothetical protein
MTYGRPVEDELVAGESVDALLRALTEFTWKRRPDGGFRISARLDREVADPLIGALLRIEAELLAEDAHLIGGSGTALRTPEQRRADALVALGLRVAEARR